MGFPGGSDGKESACNAGDSGLIPGLGSSPGEGNGNPLQYSCLENPMDRGPQSVHGVTASDATEQVALFIVDLQCCVNLCCTTERFSCVCICMCLVAQLCLTLCDPMDCSLAGSSVHGGSPDKSTGVGYHALLQGVFPTQGSNPGLPDCRWILYSLSHQGSPRILE